jgi:hypothetical protein
MSTVALSDIFDVAYGNKFDLCKMKPDNGPSAISFIGRTARNNGVTGLVARFQDVSPYEAGSITVALGGAILSSFVQDRPFYTAQNVAVLTPKVPLSMEALLYYCAAIELNRFRYSAFGREANRTLRSLPVPCVSEIPDWASAAVELEALRLSHRLLSLSRVKL